MKYASAYGIALVLFLAIDLLWLGVIARSFNVSRIGHLLLEQPRWGVAFVFYALYVAGLVYFAIVVGIADGRWQTAALNGALFGFFAYLTFDATNLAVMKGYDGLFAAVDVAWGAALSGMVAGGTIAIMRALGLTGGA
jgi:uncharacterized membrane protein